MSLTLEDQRIGDDIHAALLRNGINNEVANFLTDIAIRIKHLEEKENKTMGWLGILKLLLPIIGQIIGLAGGGLNPVAPHIKKNVADDLQKVVEAVHKIE